MKTSAVLKGLAVGALGGITLLSQGTGAKAISRIIVTEENGDVVARSSGSVNLSGLTNVFILSLIHI